MDDLRTRFPFFSSYLLKTNLGNQIPFWAAFVNILAMSLLLSLIDVVILDWLIISKITPQFVIIPGSEKEDYSDLSHHYRAQAKASIGILGLSLIMAGIVWYL